MPKQLNYKKIIKFLLFFVLFAWFTIIFISPVDYTGNDLGRHLANGREIIKFLSSELHEKTNIFNSNYYSYTTPDFPFINHHWASGLVFYIIWIYFGPKGIGIFCLFTILISLSILSKIALKKSSFKVFFFTSILIIPMIAFRNEMRPEIFSYLFLAIIFYILNSYRENPAKNKNYLYFIPLIMMLFVNFHIYFVFGFFLIGVFVLDGLLFYKEEKKYTENLIIIGILSAIAGLINPLGYKTLLYPLNIFNNYGVQVTENYNLFEAAKYKKGDALAFFFLISFCIYIFSLIASIYKKYDKKIWLQVVIMLAFAVLSFDMIRNVPVFALFLFVFLPQNIDNFIKNSNFSLSKFEKKIYTCIIFIFLIIYSLAAITKRSSPFFTFSPLKNQDDAANFVISNRLEGPMLNDFNTGGYVIFNLYPQIKPFMDNRPEAYPKEFEEHTYSLMFLNGKIWEDTLAKYNFNFIFIDNYGSNSPFIKKISKDNEWYKAFENEHHVIFLRNNNTNSELIKKLQNSQAGI